ncbi:CrcB family protein [Nocardioides flavescens]|uniref:Fluoride-specific ion channel FluC n=1 Tax=Nocardioides flavescens TaxID=2691959 RepID=A0A6L7EWG0_9ACTN|nr:CrcB family protein [Nocardioides flavescens]
MTPLWVALGAGLGATLRFVAATRFDRDRAPRGTFVVNVVGSLLLGLLFGLAVGEHTMALLGVGFCGGLTTFSAFSVQTHRLGAGRGSAYAAATVVVSLAACALGYGVGTLA